MEPKTIPQKRPFRYDVYCQTCGKEITQLGGYLGENGRSYCVPKDNSSISECIFKAGVSSGEIISSYLCTPSELQKAIFEEKLVRFEKLERDVSNK